MPVSPTILIYAVLVAKVSRQSIYIPLKLFIGLKVINVLALLDSGAGGNFMDTTFTKDLTISLFALDKPIKALNVDRIPNKEGMIINKVNSDILTNDLHMTIDFYVTGLGKVSVILGYKLGIQMWIGTKELFVGDTGLHQNMHQLLLASFLDCVWT